MASTITIEQLRNNVAELQSMYSCEPIRNRFGFTLTHTDLLGRQNASMLLDEEYRQKLKELNKVEQNATQARSNAWTEFLNNHEAEKIRFQDNPDFTQNCSERFSCSICRVALPNFEHYLLHFFGNLHSQRKRRVAMKANRLDMCSWDKLIQLLCEARIMLNEIRFDNWTMPDNQYKVRMQVGEYKFQVVGSDFKSMRLKVIDKALDFAEANFCPESGCRVVRFPYLPEIERAPVVIDNIKSTYLYSLPKPLNDDPTLPIETIVMSLIDYAACSVAAEEKRRYGKYLMDIFKKAHLSRKAAFCDICDVRLPEGLCAAHLTSLRHFRNAADLLPMRRCVEMSLVRGVPLTEVDGYAEISESFKKVQDGYRAPYELIDLLKRYCYYYCAFCKLPIRHEAELERHLVSEGHLKCVEAKEADKDDHMRNRQLMKECIRQMLIPAEYKNEVTSIDQLPESVRNELPLNDYTDEVLEKSIEAAISDPEALIERATARFLTAPMIENKQGGKRRKRPYSGRIRGDTKRTRRRRATYGSVPMPTTRIDKMGGLDSRSMLALSDSRARIAAFTEGEERSRDSRRMADELRRRRGLLPGVLDRPMLRRPPSPLLHSLASSLSADRRYYGRPTMIDRLRDRVSLYDEPPHSSSGSGVYGGGNQWSGSMDHRDGRHWSSRPLGRDEYPVSAMGGGPVPGHLDHSMGYPMPPYQAGVVPSNASMYSGQYGNGSNGGPVGRNYYRSQPRM